MMDSVSIKFYRSMEEIILHPDFESVLEVLRNSIHRVESGLKPKNFMLLGDTGTGKTTVIDCLLREFPPRLAEDRTLLPVLKVDVPSPPTVKSLTEAILIAIGDPAYAMGTAAGKTERIVNYLEMMGVYLLVFDEIHHFVDQGNKNSATDVGLWLKSLVNKSNVSVVLMGLAHSEVIKERNSELRRRFSKTLRLNPFDLGARGGRKSFLGTINHVIKKMPLESEIDLKNKDMVARLHYATNGTIDYILKLLVEAYEIAMMQGIECLDQSLLEAAFITGIWDEGVGEVNPFNKDFKWQKLDRIGMPFYRGSSSKEPRRLAVK